jgi:hypothetical protein
MILTCGVALESKDGLQWKAGAYIMLSIRTNKIAEANKSRTVHKQELQQCSKSSKSGDSGNLGKSP